MKLILGLGNPGRAYESTRHNVGWWVVDHLAGVWQFGPWKHDGESLIVSGRVGGTPVRLAKPLTYMNLSGAALRPFLRRTAFVPAQDLLVVLDEVALPVGSFRLRARGSDGGHNGLKSIEGTLGNRDYARLRIGISPADRPESARLADFVLSRFGKDDRGVVEEQLPVIASALETWVKEGIEPAMNRFNRKRKPGAESGDDEGQKGG